MKAKLIIVLLLALLSGCKTTKQTVTTQGKVYEHLKNDIQSTSERSVVVKANDSVIETLLENDNQVIEETVIELSVPDSTGKQHPERVTTRKTVAGKQIQKQMVAEGETDTAVSVRKTEDDNSVRQTDTSMSEQVKTKQVWRSPGFWISAITVMLLLNAQRVIASLKWVIVRLRRLLLI